MRDLSAHLRHLYVIQTMGEVPDSFAVTAEHTDRLAGQADRLSQGDVLRAIDLLAAALAAVKDGSEPRLQLELALLKATQPQSDQSLQALMHRIDRLEAALAGSPPALPRPRCRAAARGSGTRARGCAGAAPSPAEPPAPPAPPVADVEWGGGRGGRRGHAGAGARAVPSPCRRRARRARSRARDHALAGRRRRDPRAERDGRRPARRGRPDRDRGRPPDDPVPRRRRLLEEEGRSQPRACHRRAAQPRRPRDRRRLRAAARSSGERSPATLTADELAERLMRDFAAEEIFENDESESED